MNSTMIDLSIRIAKENDIPWMYDSISSNSNIQYNYFEREIKNSKISYIIELNKVPMGYLLASNIKDSSMDLHILIHPAVRKTGFGLKACYKAFEFFNEKFFIDKFYFKISTNWPAAMALVKKLEGEIVKSNEDESVFLVNYSKIVE